MADYDIDPDVDAWTRDWRRLRHQKHRQRGGVEGSYLLDYLLFHGEHQSVQVQNAIMTRAFKHDKDKNRLRLVINLAQRAAERKMGRFWSIAHKYRATPNTRDPLAFDKADVISDSLIPATDKKLQQDTLRWELLFWKVICGVVFEHIPWRENCTQEVLPKYDEMGNLLWRDSLTGAEIPEEAVKTLLATGKVAAERFEPAKEVQSAGDVCGEVYDPFRVFVDAAVTQVKKLGADQAIYLADIRTRGWIQNEFGSNVAKKLQPGKDLSIIETTLLDRGVPVSGCNLKDLLPLVQGSQDKDDPDMFIVLTRYQPAGDENPDGLRSFLVPGQCALDKGVNPYPEVPIVDFHYGTPVASMWTTGFMRSLQSMSKFINKRFSQLGEASNAQLYEMLLLGGDLKQKNIPTDFPGVVEGGLTDEGLPLVQAMPRGGLPTFFVDSIRLSMETLDSLGSSDLLSQRKFPGQLRGPLAIPMLQEILDSEDGPRFSHFAEQFSTEKQMRVNRIKQFYEPIRTMNYTGSDGRNEVLEFHTDEVLRAGVDFTISIDPGTLLPEMSAMREARVRERLQWAPGLYTSRRTGTLDWTRVASDLKYNDTQRDSLESQSRKLARQFIRWAREGKLSNGVAKDPTTGQPAMDEQGHPKMQIQRENGRPFVIFPFWDHDAMMDEYESEMSTGEFQDASPPYQRVMLMMHDLHRTILTQISQARQSSVQDQMTQGAVAQATQQAAAKAASVAAEAAIDQIISQNDQPPSGMFGNLNDQIRQLLGASGGGGMEAGGGQGPAQPQARQPMIRRRLGQA